MAAVMDRKPFVTRLYLELLLMEKSFFYVGEGNQKQTYFSLWPYDTPHLTPFTPVFWVSKPFI